MLANTRLTLATASLGFLSTTAQVIALREILVAFTGNELTVATTLALWLLSVAAGCFVLRRILDLTNPHSVGFLSIMAGFAAVLQVILIRLLHPVAAAPGELLSPAMMALISLAGVMPCAVALGGLFVGLVSLAGHSGARAPVARTYGIEAIGSALAGMVLSVFVLEKGNAFIAVGLAGLLSTLAGVLLFRSGNHHTAATSWAASRWMRTTLPLAALAFFGGVMVWSGNIELATRQFQWGDLEVVESADSRHGSIVVTRRGTTFDFFQSGALAHTVPDPKSAEETVHIPLLYHPGPERILIIGGAGSGVVSEVARHQMVRALYIVELDPAVLEITGRYAPEGWIDNSSIEAHAIYGDGRAHIAGTGEAYDVVIINVGVPTSLQVNRYYTVEFFRQVRRVLKPRGILAFTIPSGGAFISPELGSLAASMARGASEVFTHVEVLPGEVIHLLASQELDLRKRSETMIETLIGRELNTAYVNEYRLWERLVPLERARMDSLITEYGSVSANTDSKPVSASFAIERWARHFTSGRLLSSLTERVTLRSSAAFIVFGALVVSGVIILVTRSSVMALPGALMVYSVGVTTMFTQILIVLCFQVVSGYMYGRIAALIASFMLGMGLASTLAGLRDISRNPRLLLAFQVVLVALPLLVVAAFKALSGGALAHTIVPEGVFIALALLAGGAGGAVFAGGSNIISMAHPEIADAGAVAYSVDLLGAAGAGFAAGLLAIPSLGLAGSAYAVSVANIILLVPLLIGWRIHRGSLPR